MCYVSKFIRVCRKAIAFMAFLGFTGGQAWAEPALLEPLPISHPVMGRNAAVITKQLGDFGESFVHAGLRARGFEVLDGNSAAPGSTESR